MADANESQTTVLTDSAAPATDTPPAGDKPAVSTTSSTTQQTQEGTQSDPKSGEAKAQETSSAEIEIKLPEGVQADKDLIEAFKPLAKEFGLDSAKAQKLVDLVVGRQQAQLEQVNAEWQKTVKGWADTAKADKEFGGDKWNASLATARKAIDAFGDAELKKVLDESGLGNHPALIRAFVKAGKAMSEDRLSGGLHGAATESREFSPIDLYPSMQPKS